jgi:hypothetical protein
LLHHNGQTFTFPAADTSSSWTAFFTDVPHEITPVVGKCCYRVCLTYHLLRVDICKNTVSEYASICHSVPNQSIRLFSRYALGTLFWRVFTLAPWLRMAIPLNREYSTKTVSILRGSDLAMSELISSSIALVTDKFVKIFGKELMDCIMYSNDEEEVLLRDPRIEKCGLVSNKDSEYHGMHKFLWLYRQLAQKKLAISTTRSIEMPSGNSGPELYYVYCAAALCVCVRDIPPDEEN